MKRIQLDPIIKDLNKKMVLLAGPRQVGKTFLAKQIAKEYQYPIYLNYDNLKDRAIILKQNWLDTTDLLILDELHKMDDWKNYLKGLYDTKPSHCHILVTGSARLEIFDKIGDSLAGRYFLNRLLPISPAELHQLNMPIDINKLITNSGFPEPYLENSLIEVSRWRMQYTNSMLSTDVFDFEKIQNIRAIRTLFELLQTKVGSPISYQSLAEDISIAPNTVKKYIEILEALFIIFRVLPYSKNIARSLLKEPKIYFFDTGLVQGDEGIKLENLIALCLLKNNYAKIDYLGEQHALHYLRTKDKQEVDFALTHNGKIQTIIEVKNSNHEISKSLSYFNQKYSLEAVQVVKNLHQEYQHNGIKVIKALNFLKDLYS